MASTRRWTLARIAELRLPYSRMGATVTWLLTFLSLSTGCTHRYLPHVVAPEQFAGATKALDEMRWYVDAYGSGTISEPLLFVPDDSFKFVLTQVNADSLFASEKNEISGREAASTASAQVSGASLTGAVDLAAMQQYVASLAASQQAQAVIAQKQQIQNQAALQQYQAAVQAAQSIGDPAQQATAMSAAASQFIQAMAGPAPGANNPLPTAGAPPTLPSPASGPNLAASLLPPLASAQSLFSSGTPSVSGDSRTSLLMAAGDNATMAMLGLLGDANKMSAFNGKRVLFGLSMVSVNPGWKTRNGGFSADVRAHLAYCPVLARPAVRDAFMVLKSDSPIEEAALQQLQTCVAASITKSPPTDDDIKDMAQGLVHVPRPYDGIQFQPWVLRSSEASPVVAAVSPMGDAQSLDLQSSTRNMQERAMQMAFALSYVGLSAQANIFRNWAREQQNDVETRTSNVLIGAYASGVSTFGFKAFPRVQADAGKGGTSNALDVPTFPTLLVIGADDDDLHPRIFVTSSGDCSVVEPQLQFFQTTRWVPLTTPDCTESRGCAGQVLTETERMSATRNLDYALTRASESFKASEGPPDAERGNAGASDQKAGAAWIPRVDGSILKQLRRLAYLYEGILNGDVASLFYPVDFLKPIVASATPTVDAIAPGDVHLDRDSVGNPTPRVLKLLVAGSNLDQIDLTKISSVTGTVEWLTAPTVGATTKVPQAKLVGSKTLQLLFQVESTDPVVFKLPVRNSTTVVNTLPLAVRPPEDLTIQNTLGKDPNTGITTETIHFSPTVPRDVLKSQIEKDKKVYPPSNANVNVDVSASSSSPKGQVKP